MTRHIQDPRTGRMAGSIGEGKYRVPLSAPDVAWVRLSMKHPLNIISGKLVKELWVSEESLTVITDAGTYTYTPAPGGTIAEVADAYLLTRGHPVAGIEFTPGVGYRITTYTPLRGKVWATIYLSGGVQEAQFVKVEPGQPISSQTRVDTEKKRRRVLWDFFSSP